MRERFEALGLTIGGWADERGYPRETVYGVLSGRIAGKRGMAHRIAVDLGLKTTPDLADERTQRLLPTTESSAQERVVEDAA